MYNKVEFSDYVLEGLQLLLPTGCEAICSYLKEDKLMLVSDVQGSRSLVVTNEVDPCQLECCLDSIVDLLHINEMWLEGDDSTEWEFIDV